MTNQPPIEYCVICDDPTGRAGRAEDSLYIQHADESETGPLCEGCYEDAKAMADAEDKWSQGLLSDMALKSLASAAGFCVESDGSITDGIENSQRLNEELRKFAFLVIEQGRRQAFCRPRSR